MDQALLHVERYAGQTALVLGLGESGLAMALWLAGCGVGVRVADTRSEAALAERLAQLREQAPDAVVICGELNVALLDGVDFVAVSPGLAPERELEDIAAAAAERAIPLWSEIELFAQALAVLHEQRGYAPKIIAITGTNGKTTVTSLTAQMCRRAGMSVEMGGNISPAALDMLRQALRLDALPQVWVLELSSFQLYATYSLRPDAATVLNITQDHLDWHGDMAAYTAAKQRIFAADTIRVLNRDDALVMAMAAGAPALSTFGSDQPAGLDSFGLVNENGMLWLAATVPLEEQEKKRARKEKPSNDPKKQMQLVDAAVAVNRLMPADALKIRGLHNAVNGLAALALCRAIDLPLAPLLHGLRDYAGEPHRVELLTTIVGVEYYDDSKGTNVGATVAALNGLGHGGRPNRLLLIAGGEGKGQDFTPLAEPLSKYARAVLLIGRDAACIREAVASAGVELIDCPTLEAAVEKAATLAQAGDAVLLSPACASMDMFRNYAHRAEVFAAAVREAALARGEIVA
jgi:UDP-N-acetylmuramoylalanine--D-glutamate ligase